LRSRHANTLIPPVAAPADAAEHMGPVLWFLGRVEGARLTQAGYLPTDMVREASERFGWTVEPFGTPPRSESELGPLFEIHEMLRRSGAVYRRHGRVHVSRSGASLGDDTEAAWRWTAAHMLTHPWEFAVTEVMTLQLLDGAVDERAAIEQATRILGATWRVGGRRPDRTGVYHGFAPAQRMLRTLHGLERRGEWPERVLELNGFGRATLLEQLRSRATGPATPTV
jgi:hypothetical protein